MSRRPSDRGFTRNNLDDGPADRRRQAFEPAGDGRVRDFSNWERKGPLTPSGSFSDQQQPREPRPSAGGVGAERSFSRRDSPSWGEGQSASRPPREFAERPPPVDRTPTAAEMDTQWRTKMRPDAPPPAPITAAASTGPASDVGDVGAGTSADASVPSSPVAPLAPASRPRLNLQKRTVSEAPAAGNGDGSPAPGGDAKASPFGAARPIDTTQREREIEEKARAKREEAAKLRKEEDAKRAAEREKERERTAAAAKTTETKPGAPRGTQDKPPAAANESGAPHAHATDAQQQQQAAAAAAKPTKILQRTTEQEDGAGDAPPEVAGAAEDGATAAGQDADANGVIVDDKAVKPQEVTRDIGSGGNGDAAASSTAEALEEDGWHTVEKSGKKGRIGGGRAAAS